LNHEDLQLSDRERTVLLLASEGLTDKEIAKHLNLSQRTIGTYWERTRHKLGAHPRTHLVARFLRSESERRDSSENLGNVFHSWEEGVWILSHEGRTIYANQPVSVMLGERLDPSVGCEALNLCRDRFGFDLRKFVEASKSSSQETEIECCRRDGTSLWVRLRGTPVTDRKGRASAVVLLFQDVTVQRRVRHTLQSCQSALDFLSSRSSDLIARFDVHLRCVSINPPFLEVLGVAREHVVGRNLIELGDVFRPVDAWEHQLHEALATGSAHSFKTHIGNLQPALETHLLPEPSVDLETVGVMSITPLRPNGILPG
jgi:PAS domain S-box-containing protein